METETDNKNRIAAELGRLGGQKTAERGPGYYAEIQALRKIRGGGRPRILSAIREADLEIGGMTIPCAVLEDGTRVLSRIGFLRAIGRTGKAKGGRKYDEESKTPVFLTAANLRPFIPSDLIENSNPVPFRTLSGTTAMGYKADLLPQVCNVFQDAKEKGVLKINQLHIAEKCKILSRGFAIVGITALIDEATGYQDVRDRQALQAILERFLRKEFAAWAKRFPDEFYKEMFRLRGWEWKGMTVNRPQAVANYTKDLVYERLAPGILKALEEKNPADERGRRRQKHHQWLTEDIGHPALAQHLYALIGFMRASSNWAQFYHLVQRGFPKRGQTLLLPLEDCEAGGAATGS